MNGTIFLTLPRLRNGPSSDDTSTTKCDSIKTRQQSLASVRITQMDYTLEAPPTLQSELESLRMKNATQQAHLATIIEQLQKQCLPPPLVPVDTATVANSVANSALLSAISPLSDTLIKVKSPSTPSALENKRPNQ